MLVESEAFSLRVDAQPQTTPQARPGLQQAVASKGVRLKDVERTFRIFPTMETCCLFTVVWMQRYDSVLIFHTILFWLLGEFRSFEGTVAKCCEHLKYVASLLRVACWWFAHQLGPPGYMPCNADRFATIGFWLWLMRQSDGIRAGLFCPLNKKMPEVVRSFIAMNILQAGKAKETGMKKDVLDW